MARSQPCIVPSSSDGPGPQLPAPSSQSSATATSESDSSASESSKSSASANFQTKFLEFSGQQKTSAEGGVGGGQAEIGDPSLKPQNATGTDSTAAQKLIEATSKGSAATEQATSNEPSDTSASSQQTVK